jgi:hypothetical protein
MGGMALVGQRHVLWLLLLLLLLGRCVMHDITTWSGGTLTKVYRLPK